ncbi:hypothetical protein FRB90_012753 [Tulasnella sp. 427]|nr:hypothetical protein FRB90_012753 [Tulasnella sp. 427]
MRSPTIPGPSKLHLQQRPNDMYSGSNRRLSWDSPVSAPDRSQNSNADRTTTNPTNGFAPTNSTAPEVFSITPTRSNGASSLEEGEVDEDEIMQVDVPPAPPSATQVAWPATNITSNDEFTREEKAVWYRGHLPHEPARAGVLDDSMTLEDYVEAQLLVLDILGYGVPADKLFGGFGISPTLLTTIFQDLQLQLPQNSTPQDPPPTSQSLEEYLLWPRRDDVVPSTSTDRLSPLSSTPPRVSSAPTPDHQADLTPLQPEVPADRSSVAPGPLEELLRQKRTEVLRAKLQRRKALQNKPVVLSSSETPGATSSPIPSALSESSNPMKADIHEAEPPQINVQDLDTIIHPPLSSSSSSSVMDALESITPPLVTPNKTPAMEAPDTVPTPDETRDGPPRKRTKLDLLLREKLAKVKAKEAVASRSKSPSIPPSLPPHTSSPPGSSEAITGTFPLPDKGHDQTETAEDPSEPSRNFFQPSRSAASNYFSYDVPAASTPVALDYGLASASPEITYVKPPTRSYSYDSRLNSRTGKRLRATDFIDNAEVQTFFPMLDPYTTVVIDVSEDEDEVEQQVRGDSPVASTSDDAQSEVDTKSVDLLEPAEAPSVDAFLGSLMEELIEPAKPDPNDEIKRLKAKIAAMEAKHKKRILQQDGSSRQASEDPVTQGAGTSVSATPDVSAQDGVAFEVISVEAGEEADVEDDADDGRDNGSADAEFREGNEPLATDEDGDQDMADVDNSTKMPASDKPPDSTASILFNR